jgi:hypothetical protein
MIGALSHLRLHQCIQTLRRDAMATLSVLKFDDPRAAARTLIALQGMQDRNMITLEDAAVVS